MSQSVRGPLLAAGAILAIAVGVAAWVLLSKKEPPPSEPPAAATAELAPTQRRGTAVIEGQSPPREVNVIYQVTDEHTMKERGLHMLAGRIFTEMDTAWAPPAAIVNEAMARVFWPQENPVGRRILDQERRSGGALADGGRDHQRRAPSRAERAGAAHRLSRRGAGALTCASP